MTNNITPDDNDPIREPDGKAEQPGPERPAAEQPGPARPAADEPTTEQPGPERPAAEQPGPERPGPEQPGPERPAADEPTTERPAAEAGATATAEQPAPRRLYRSRTDRVIGGVCGGLAAYFRIDPVIVRVGAVALTFLGGAGVLLYLAALLLVPREAEGGGPPEVPHRGLAVAGAIVLIIAIGVLLPGHWSWWGGGWLLPIGLVALAGLLVWRLATGERPQGDARAVLRAMAIGVALIALCAALALGAGWGAAAGGAGAVAGIVVAAGLALIAGAFLGSRARWLILPALAVALPAGVVAAADINVKGGAGERVYRPASSADVRDSYDVGVGQLVVDLRRTRLDPGDHHLKLRVGVGEAKLVVPRNVCVSTDSHLGAGGVRVFERDSGGLDVDWQDHREAATGNPRVIVDANVGLGVVVVNHDGSDDFGRHASHGRNTGCA